MFMAQQFLHEQVSVVNSGMDPATPSRLFGRPVSNGMRKVFRIPAGRQFVWNTNGTSAIILDFGPCNFAGDVIRTEYGWPTYSGSRAYGPWLGNIVPNVTNAGQGTALTNLTGRFLAGVHYGTKDHTISGSASASGTTITLAGNGLAFGQRVRFDVAFGSLAANTDYYVVSGSGSWPGAGYVQQSTFSVATAPNGTAISVGTVAATPVVITTCHGGFWSNISTTAGTNIVTTAQAHRLTPTQAVVFDQSFGGINAGQVYYVASTPSTTTFTLAESYTNHALGPTVVLSTVAAALRGMRKLHNHLSANFSCSGAVVTVDRPHGLAVNDCVVFETALGNIAAETFYFVTSTTSTEFSLSGTKGGAAIDCGTAGPAFAVISRPHRVQCMPTNASPLSLSGQPLLMIGSQDKAIAESSGQLYDGMEVYLTSAIGSISANSRRYVRNLVRAPGYAEWQYSATPTGPITSVGGNQGTAVTGTFSVNAADPTVLECSVAHGVTHGVTPQFVRFSTSFGPVVANTYYLVRHASSNALILARDYFEDRLDFSSLVGTATTRMFSSRSVSIAVNGTVTFAVGHGLSIGDRIRFSPTVGPFTEGTDYFVLTAPTATTATFGVSAGGATITTGTAVSNQVVEMEQPETLSAGPTGATLLCATAHGLSSRGIDGNMGFGRDRDPLVFFTSSFGPIVADTPYFVRRIPGTTRLQLTSTYRGPLIDFTGVSGVSATMMRGGSAFGHRLFPIQTNITTQVSTPVITTSTDHGLQPNDYVYIANVFGAETSSVIDNYGGARPFWVREVLSPTTFTLKTRPFLDEPAYVPKVARTVNNALIYTVGTQQWYYEGLVTVSGGVITTVEGPHNLDLTNECSFDLAIGGLTAGTKYFVSEVLSPTQFRVAATYGGASIALTDEPLPVRRIVNTGSPQGQGGPPLPYRNDNSLTVLEPGATYALGNINGSSYVKYLNVFRNGTMVLRGDNTVVLSFSGDFTIADMGGTFIHEGGSVITLRSDFQTVWQDSHIYRNSAPVTTMWTASYGTSAAKWVDVSLRTVEITDAPVRWVIKPAPPGSGNFHAECAVRLRILGAGNGRNGLVLPAGRSFVINGDTAQVSLGAGQPHWHGSLTAEFDLVTSNRPRTLTIEGSLGPSSTRTLDVRGLARLICTHPGDMDGFFGGTVMRFFSYSDMPEVVSVSSAGTTDAPNRQVGGTFEFLNTYTLTRVASTTNPNGSYVFNELRLAAGAALTYNTAAGAIRDIWTNLRLDGNATLTTTSTGSTGTYIQFNGYSGAGRLTRRGPRAIRLWGTGAIPGGIDQDVTGGNAGGNIDVNTGVTLTLGSLTINGTPQAPGSYTASALTGFTGSGTVEVQA